MKKKAGVFNAVLSVIIISIIVIGGLSYITNVQNSLRLLSVTDMKQVTAQASHAFETYIKKDLQSIHCMTAVMSRADSDDLDYIAGCLEAYKDMPDDSFYSVIDLEKGIIYSDQLEGFSAKLTPERLEAVRNISGTAVEEPYISDINGMRVLACEESFTFADGVPGVIRKAFPVSKIMNEFALSVYDGEGYSYIVNKSGDILVRSFHKDSSHTYRNIFDAIEMRSEHEADTRGVIDRVSAAMKQGKSGAVRFTSEGGREIVYTYVPINGTNGWYYVTVIPSSVLMEQSNHILNLSQLYTLAIALIVIIVFIVLVLARRNQKAMMRIEREEQNREKLFDILTNGTGDAFVMVKMKDKTVDYVSPNIHLLLGITAEEVRNDPSVLLDAKDSGSDFTSELSGTEIGGALSLERRRVNRMTGEPQWFVITIYRVMIENSERAIVVFSDRTNEKRRENELKDATNIAESANRAKSSFLSNMSHDIRTPMNAIVGLCTLIERDADDKEKVRTHTKKMLASCQHLLGLINDVLDMSKIEAGKTSLNITELNLAEIVDELVTVMLPQAHAKQQTFDMSLIDVKSEHLLGDKLRINQILINIVSNAIKYTPEGGRIELIIRETPRKVKGFAHMRFIVRDNGNGISPDYIDNIFQAFTRETNSTTNKIQGTGLGMAITKSLVDLMEGNISVESELGKGSTFTVDLDLHIQNREAERKFWEKHGISRMLVVDDEKEACEYVVSAMERVGVSAEYATDGPSAIEAAEKAEKDGNGFDLILMDLKMPDMDGIEASRRIREKIPRETPILAFTSYDWNVVEENAKKAGINGFMSKPFFISNLELSIERLGQEEPPALPAADGIMNGMHILAAEDNALNSEILEELLDICGATCDIEENGEKVLNRFLESEEGYYNIILMDIQMPVMNGYEASKAIRGCAHPQAKTIPILAMTADAFAEDVRRAIESGMNAHISKPIELKLLEEAVREVTGHQEVNT